MKTTYKMEIAGLTRELPLCPLTDTLQIGAFVIFGDVELTVACARELLKKAPEFDYIIGPEAKTIPLLYEMAKQSGKNHYYVFRKKKKAYMGTPLETTVHSITTAGEQKLYFDGNEAAMVKGKRVLILDDVISTGESLRASEDLVNQAGGIIVGKMAILAEDKAALRDDIDFIAALPLFDKEGNPLPIE